MYVDFVDMLRILVDLGVFELDVVFLFNFDFNRSYVLPLLPERKYLWQSMPLALLCCMSLSAPILYLSIRCLVNLMALSTAFLKSPSLLTQISIPIDCWLYDLLPACQH